MYTGAGSRSIRPTVPAARRHGRAGTGVPFAQWQQPKDRVGGRHKTATPNDDADRIKTVARNRRARHDYDILETFECGLALQGSEVKSLRAGRVTLADAYARVEEGEAWLLGVHIPPYDHAAGSGPTIPSAGASCSCTATRSTS